VSGSDYLLAVISDTHCGSTVGLCPPEGVEHDDGGGYTPSDAQKWMWNDCFLPLLERVKVEAKGCKLLVDFNGDLVDGWHHSTSQTVSLNPGAQAYVVKRMADEIRALKPHKVYVVRGTTVHVGEGGSSEEDVAKYLKADREEGRHTWSTWHLRLNLNGHLFDFQHHGRMSTRPWTKGSVLGALAFQIWSEHQLAGLQAPEFAIRSHRHVYGDSGTSAPTRVIATPSFQLKTSYAHKVAAESIADIGGCLFHIPTKGRVEHTPVLFTPSLPKVRTP
jgi:hypothetical protein